MNPVSFRGSRYQVPHAPGYSIQMRDSTLAQYSFPDGTYWRGVR